MKHVYYEAVFIISADKNPEIKSLGGMHEGTHSVYASITKCSSLRHQTFALYPGNTLKFCTCDIEKVTCLGHFSCSLTIKPGYCILCSQRTPMQVPWNNRFTSQEIIGSPRIKLLIFNTKPNILELMDWIPKRVRKCFVSLCKFQLPTRNSKHWFPPSCPRHVFYVCISVNHSQANTSTLGFIIITALTQELTKVNLVFVAF